MIVFNSQNANNITSKTKSKRAIRTETLKKQTRIKKLKITKENKDFLRALGFKI